MSKSFYLDNQIKSKTRGIWYTQYPVDGGELVGPELVQELEDKLLSIKQNIDRILIQRVGADKLLEENNKMEKRNTPEDINELAENEIFVFGSNEGGIHGHGAALRALRFGAIRGKGVGLVGRTYGIPTKNKKIQTLPLSSIEPYVKDFIEFARQNPQYTFLVTKIGCGLANFTIEDIAPMFKDAIEIPNIILPKEFVLAN